MTTEQLTAHAKTLHAKMLAAGLTTETEAEFVARYITLFTK